jgi:hypothetical protein
MTASKGLTKAEAVAARTMGMRAADARRREFERSGVVDLRLELNEPAPTLPTLTLFENDTRQLRCLRACGQPAWLDHESLIQSKGKTALWICKAGHDGYVRVALASGDPRRRGA